MKSGKFIVDFAFIREPRTQFVPVDFSIGRYKDCLFPRLGIIPGDRSCQSIHNRLG